MSTLNIGLPELGITGVIAIFGVLPLAFGIWTAVDAARYPNRAFEAAQTSKTLWIVLPLVGVFACGIVAIVAWLVWLSSVRPKVVAAVETSAPPPFPDGPPSGWAPPAGPPQGTSPGWPPPPEPPEPPEPPGQRPPDPR